METSPAKGPARIKYSVGYSSKEFIIQLNRTRIGSIHKLAGGHLCSTCPNIGSLYTLFVFACTLGCVVYFSGGKKGILFSMWSLGIWWRDL